MLSMYTVARRATSQLVESRASPIAKPSTVASVIPITETSTVFNSPTQNTRAFGDITL
jgi:hypothetical protein